MWTSYGIYVGIYNTGNDLHYMYKEPVIEESMQKELLWHKGL